MTRAICLVSLLLASTSQAALHARTLEDARGEVTTSSTYAATGAVLTTTDRRSEYQSS